MSVGPDEVRRVAELARLPLGPGEVASMTRQLNRILEHVDALAEADAEAVGEAEGAVEGANGAGLPGESMAPDDAAGPTPLRADRPGADPLATPPSELAPAWADGLFTVPRLASHDDGRDGPGGGGSAP